MDIHQLIVSATPGDAISDAALENRGLLRRVANSEIIAAYRDPCLTRDILSIADYESLDSAQRGDNLLLVHLSIGDMPFWNFLCSRRERVVPIYHNITPSKYFEPFDRRFANLLDLGRIQVECLRDRVGIAIADSEFNAAELRNLGFTDVRVVPLVVDPKQLLKVRPDKKVVARLATSIQPQVLFVGQMLPHKKIELLLDAYAVLVNELVPEAALTLAGAARLPAYERALKSHVRDLALQNVSFTGAISSAELVAHFRNATVLVTASEHEGLCLPVLEAMAFGVPVIARSVAALADTVGDAGLLLPADANALLMAEAMASVIESADLRANLIARGTAHIQNAFDPEVARAAFLEAMLEAA